MGGRFGALPLFRFSIFCMIVTCMFLPWIPAVAGRSPMHVWPSLIIARGLQEFFKQCLFIASFRFVNNSTTIQQRGLVNGVAISFASITKGLGPIVGGTVFAFTVSHDLPYPLNIHGAWILMAGLYFLLFVLSWRLPASISKPIETAFANRETEAAEQEHRE